jgi:hypothetical protein
MSWVNKIFSLCSKIVSCITSFFTPSALSKAAEYVPKDVTLNQDILASLAQQDQQIALIVETLNTLATNQSVIQSHVVTSFQQLLDLRQTLTIVQNQIAAPLEFNLAPVQTSLQQLLAGQANLQNNGFGSFNALNNAILDVRQMLNNLEGQIQIMEPMPVNLAPMQASLQQLVTDQIALTTNVLDGFRLTGESLTRVESINFTEKFATIIQNQGTVQTNLKAQVMSTGSELGGLITQLNVNVLSIPSESIAQATEFFTTNPALANIVANALV